MNWEDEGFIISKRRFRENAILLEVFTSKFGKSNGIVYGGTSRKIKNTLQLMNKIFIIYNSKGVDRLGYFKTELISPISPNFFNNKNKILCINSITSLLKSVLPENQPYEKIYNSLNSLLNDLSSDKWLITYLIWEIGLINDLGFGFSIDQNNLKNLNNETVDIKLDNIRYNIPSFLISKNFNSLKERDIYNGLSFSRNLLENKFFTPNNIRIPYSRKMFEKNFL